MHTQTHTQTRTHRHTDMSMKHSFYTVFLKVFMDNEIMNNQLAYIYIYTDTEDKKFDWTN